MNDKLILIGPPGAGKSTIGHALAKKMKVKFADTDSIIEAKLGKKISDIFLELGETIFRAEELQVLTDVLKSDSQVISLGGGAPISDGAQTLIRDSSATVIFLDISLAKAAARVGFNRNRPLLLGNPRAQWTELMNTRRPIYEGLATAIVQVDDRSISEICADILAVG